MLNCCIERRKAREVSVYGDVSMTSAVKQSSQSDDEDDDEFYECETDTAAAAAADTTESNSLTVNRAAGSTMQCDSADGGRVSSQVTESSLYQASGRLKPCADLRLLNVNECVYVPVTQEPAPMTEDMLEEHAEVLARYELKTAVSECCVSCVGKCRDVTGVKVLIAMYCISLLIAQLTQCNL